MRTLARTRGLLCLGIIAASGLLAADGDETDVKVEATGLRVVAPAKETALRAFNWQAGTTLALLISSDKGGFVQFDQKNSVVAKLVDDKGNDLLTKSKGEPWFGIPGFGMLTNISKDGKACAVEVLAPLTPAKGAASIKLEGVLTMLCASDKKEHAQKDVPLKNGTKLTAGRVELAIDKIGKPEHGAEPLCLTLRSTMELDEVAEVKFYRVDGGEIKSRRTGTSKMGILGAMTVEWDYNLAESADAATVKVFLWSDLQKKRVPFNLNINVGL